MAPEFARQRTRCAMQHCSRGPKTVPNRQPATQFFTLHEGQSSVPCHVQLLGSWLDQDTGVALEH
jgi:hypothetical protein